MPLHHYQDAGADSSAPQSARTIPFPHPNQTHPRPKSMPSRSPQLINYLVYHKAMTMRMAEDKSIKPIDRCVWNALFVLWNESEWAPEIEASPAWIMDATGIGNKGTAVDALERLNAAGYITVKTSRGNRGGTFITLPPYSKEEISKWPKSGLFENSKCTRSGLLEPESNSPEVVYSNVPEVVYLEDSNRPEMVHSYTSIPTVQTTDNVVKHPTTTKQTFVPNGTSAGSAAPPEKKDAGEGRKAATPQPPKPPAPAGPKEKKVARKKEKVTAQPVTLPWDSEAFAAAWQRWKTYKLEQFRFRYKSTDSESSALRELYTTLSGGNEEIAIRLIDHAITKSWQGIYQAKEIYNGTQQQSNQYRPATGNRPTGTIIPKDKQYPTGWGK